MTMIIDGTNGLTFNDSSVQATAGKILQVVQGTASTFVSSTNTTTVDTGLSATITPKFSNSKILVLVSQRFFRNPACDHGVVYLLRNSTTLITHNRVGLVDNNAAGADQVWNCNYLDSPATTSATTYKTRFNNTNTNGVFYCMLDSNQAQITLLEIAA